MDKVKDGEPTAESVCVLALRALLQPVTPLLTGTAGTELKQLLAAAARDSNVTVTKKGKASNETPFLQRALKLSAGDYGVCYASAAKFASEKGLIPELELRIRGIHSHPYYSHDNFESEAEYVHHTSLEEESLEHILRILRGKAAPATVSNIVNVEVVEARGLIPPKKRHDNCAPYCIFGLRDDKFMYTTTTGSTLSPTWNYEGTFQIHGQSAILHFEVCDQTGRKQRNNFFKINSTDKELLGVCDVMVGAKEARDAWFPLRCGGKSNEPAGEVHLRLTSLVEGDNAFHGTDYSPHYHLLMSALWENSADTGIPMISPMADAVLKEFAVRYGVADSTRHVMDITHLASLYVSKKEPPPIAFSDLVAKYLNTAVEAVDGGGTVNEWDEVAAAAKRITTFLEDRMRRYRAEFPSEDVDKLGPAVTLLVEARRHARYADTGKQVTGPQWGTYFEETIAEATKDQYRAIKNRRRQRDTSGDAEFKMLSLVCSDLITEFEVDTLCYRDIFPIASYVDTMVSAMIPLVEADINKAIDNHPTLSTDPVWELYRNLRDLDSHVQTLVSPGTIDPWEITETFYSALEAWVNEASDSMDGSVENSVHDEKWRPTARPNQLYGSSVTYIYTQIISYFDFLRDLTWPDAGQHNEFVLLLCEGSAAAIQKYGTTVEELMMEYLTPLTRKKSVIKEAGGGSSANSAKGASAEESTTPFDCPAELCVQLSSIDNFGVRLMDLRDAVYARYLRTLEPPKPPPPKKAAKPALATSGGESEGWDEEEEDLMGEEEEEEPEALTEDLSMSSHEASVARKGGKPPVAPAAKKPAPTAAAAAKAFGKKAAPPPLEDWDDEEYPPQDEEGGTTDWESEFVSVAESRVSSASHSGEGTPRNGRPPPAPSTPGTPKGTFGAKKGAFFGRAAAPPTPSKLAAFRTHSDASATLAPDTKPTVFAKRTSSMISKKDEAKKEAVIQRTASMISRDGSEAAAPAKKGFFGAKKAAPPPLEEFDDLGEEEGEEYWEQQEELEPSVEHSEEQEECPLAPLLDRRATLCAMARSVDPRSNVSPLTGRRKTVEKLGSDVSGLRARARNQFCNSARWSSTTTCASRHRASMSSDNMLSICTKSSGNTRGAPSCADRRGELRQMPERSRCRDEPSTELCSDERADDCSDRRSCSGEEVASEELFATSGDEAFSAVAISCDGKDAKDVGTAILRSRGAHGSGNRWRCRNARRTAGVDAGSRQSRAFGSVPEDDSTDSSRCLSPCGGVGGCDGDGRWSGESVEEQQETEEELDDGDVDDQEEWDARADAAGIGVAEDGEIDQEARARVMQLYESAFHNLKESEARVTDIICNLSWAPLNMLSHMSDDTYPPPLKLLERIWCGFCPCRPPFAAAAAPADTYEQDIPKLEVNQYIKPAFQSLDAVLKTMKGNLTPRIFKNILKHLWARTEESLLIETDPHSANHGEGCSERTMTQKRKSKIMLVVSNLVVFFHSEGQGLDKRTLEDFKARLRARAEAYRMPTGQLIALGGKGVGRGAAAKSKLEPDFIRNILKQRKHDEEAQIFLTMSGPQKGVGG